MARCQVQQGGGTIIFHAADQHARQNVCGMLAKCMRKCFHKAVRMLLECLQKLFECYRDAVRMLWGCVRNAGRQRAREWSQDAPGMLADWCPSAARRTECLTEWCQYVRRTFHKCWNAENRMQQHSRASTESAFSAFISAHSTGACKGSLTLARYVIDCFLTALLHETCVFDTHYVFDSFWYVLTLCRKPCKYVGFRQINCFFEHAHSAHMLDSAMETHWSWSTLWHDPWTSSSKHNVFCHKHHSIEML